MSPWASADATSGTPNWYARTGQNANQLGQNGLTNVSDLSAEVADATSRPEEHDPNPIGHGISTGLRFVWNTAMLIGDWYNRNIYQPVIDDPLVFANLALQAPAYKQPDQSLGDYIKSAWNARDQVSLGQSSYVWNTETMGNPVSDADTFHQNLEQNGRAKLATGLFDFSFAAAADPLNYIGGPTTALTAGMTAPKIVADLEKAQTGITRTKGVISMSRVGKLLDDGAMDSSLRRLAAISDPKVSRGYLESLKLGADDPDTLAWLSSQIDDVAGQKDLFTIALTPQSEDAVAAASRLKASYGADFEYYAHKHAGNDMLAPEMFATPDDLLLGPKTQEVAQAVVDRADAANAEALARTEEFARGIDKMTSSQAPWLTNAPTTNPVFERYAWRKAAKGTARISRDPVVSKYQPHRWHPATWYIEKPAGLVEPDSPTAFAEIDASIRELDKLTKGHFVESGRADEFADRWFRASTLAEPATERSKVAAGLNEYAVNRLIKQFHGDGLDDSQIKALSEMIDAKAKRMNQEIRQKGWLSAATDSGSIGIIRHPLLQRATPNAVSMYDFRALARTIEKFDTPGLRSLTISAMNGTTSAMDALMGAWKVSVLMRLGYTIRNLAEASMSIAASGNLGNVLAEVGPERLRTWMQASKQGGGRMVDRVATAGGIWDTPQALFDQRQAWDGVRAATEASAKEALSNLDPVQIRRLVKSADPEKQAQARRLQAMRVDLESKAVTYHGRPESKITPEQAKEMGNLGEAAGWKPSKGRALSTTPSPALAGQKGAAHQVTSYGDTWDFSRGSTGPFDAALVKAAKGGDRAAVQRLSDAAVNRGYGRIILPDSPEWGGRQIVVNQRAIGKAGRARIIESKIQRLVDEAEEALPPGRPRVGTPRDARRANKASKRARARGNPLPVNPAFEDDLIDAMLNGGIEDFVSKLSSRRVAIDAQDDFLSMRLEAARRRAAKTAPLRAQGKGFQQGTSDVISANGIRYDSLPAAFGGDSGGYWERALSGNTTYSILGGDSYQGALTSGAMASKVVQPDNPRYFEAWSNILNLHFRDHQSGVVDQVVQKIIDGDSFDDILEWATSTKDGYQWARGLGITKAGAGEVPEIARKVDLADADTVEKAVASLMSAVDLYAPKGPIREALTSGAAIDQDLLRAAMKDKPLVPLQALLVPTSAEATREMTLYQRFMNRGVARAMKVLGSIPESSFARHPLFASTFQTERRSLISMAEQAKGGQRLTFADLQKVDLQAKRRAARTVEQTLFTLTRRSTVSGNAAIRTLFPFVAAWENVLQRWSKFVVADPMIPVRFSNYVDKFDRNVTVIDSDGNEVTSKDYPDDAMLVLPGLDSLHLPGRLGEAASLLATQTFVPVKSLDVLTQGQPLNPGLGPLGVLPIAGIVRRRPDVEKVFAWALPYGVPESNKQIFMPTAMQRVTQLWGDSSVATNTMSKAWLIASYRYEHEGGQKPKFEDVEKMATSMTMLRAATSLVAPFATSYTNERDFYAGKLRDYQAIYGQDDGETRFFQDFPDASLLVESLSRNPSGARATVQTVANTKKYRFEIAQAYGNNDPKVAGFVMNYGVPDDAEFSQAAYQWQRQHAPVKGSSDTYRQVGNPEDQVREAHIRDGWNLYRQVTDQVAAQMQMSGLSPDDPAYAKTMTITRQTVTDYLYREAQNTDWYQEYINPDTAKYMRRAESFKTLLADTKFARDHEGDTLIQSMRAFLTERDVVIAELQRRKMAGGSGSLEAEANIGLRAAWEADIERLGQDSPEFRAWHQDFFANDSVKA